MPHGYRSGLRDRAFEVAGADHETADLSLGHVCYGWSEASYARSDLLERRRFLLGLGGGFRILPRCTEGTRPNLRFLDNRRRGRGSQPKPATHLFNRLPWIR